MFRVDSFDNRSIAMQSISNGYPVGMTVLPTAPLTMLPTPASAAPVSVPLVPASAALPLTGLDLDAHSLRAMRAVSELGSITAAATALGYSQPAISQRAETSRAASGDAGRRTCRPRGATDRGRAGFSPAMPWR